MRAKSCAPTNTRTSRASSAPVIIRAVCSPRTIVQLSHKYYSRQIQQRLVPDATPAFDAIDPCAPLLPSKLTFPFFVKPVKGTMSIRARMVRDHAELAEAMRFSIRERLEKMVLLRPFAQLLDEYTDGRVPAHYFIGEEPLAGAQVTVDGFVQNGEVTIMGIVDSVMYPGTISFQRFEYPSRHPEGVQAKMARVVRDLIRGSGLDHTCFNVEMFYDPARDATHVIEVNPRMSYQFADLYERVDGTSTFKIQLALATGERVPWRHGAGRHRAAASFVMRRFSDAAVTAVPSAADVAEVKSMFPGTIVRVLCAAGDRLSDHDQDVGSFRYCIVNMSAESAPALYSSYDEVVRKLTFQFREL
jgi:biotin carboxylase